LPVYDDGLPVHRDELALLLSLSLLLAFVEEEHLLGLAERHLGPILYHSWVVLIRGNENILLVLEIFLESPDHFSLLSDLLDGELDVDLADLFVFVVGDYEPQQICVFLDGGVGGFM